jgi:Rieske Fe-S protein
MNEVSKSRREALKIIAATSTGVAFGTQIPVFAQTAEVKPVKITTLEKLAKDWDVATFDFQGAPSQLARVPMPKNKEGKMDDTILKSGRVLEVTVGKEKIYLTAYGLTCTHAGCKIGAPDKDHIMNCPCHGSAFSVADGSATHGPAKKSLAGIKLEVKDGAVMAVGVLAT